MLDLGSLGGTASSPQSLNNHRQVVGASNLADDVEFHPFLWEHGVMRDLGTFLGPNDPSYGSGNAINDSGDVVGWADNQQNDFPALWKGGVTINLGTVGGDNIAYANSINSRGQIVGNSGFFGGFSQIHAFLWEKGGPLVDLNTLVPSGIGVHLTNAYSINDNGVIAAIGVLGNGDQHAFALIPSDESGGNCVDNAVDTTATTKGTSMPITQRLPMTSPFNTGLRDRPILDRLRGRRFGDIRTPSPGTNR
jgi:probable HAF family extracellular repeat protein